MAYVDLDDERTADSASASSLVPVRCRDNASSLLGDRSHGAGWGGDVAGVETNAVSTHPDHYYGIPLLMPYHPDARTLHIAVYGEISADGMSLGAWCDGRWGTVALESATTGDEYVGEYTVPISQGSANRRLRCALVLQSQRAGSATGTYTVTDAGGHYVRLATSDALTAGRAHYVIEGGSFAEGDIRAMSLHAGRVEDASTGSDQIVTVWPMVPPGVESLMRTGGMSGKAYTASLTAVSTIRISGVYVWLSNSYGTILTPTVASVASGASIRSQDWRILDEAARQCYRRGYVYTTGPPSSSSGAGYAGQSTSGAGAEIHACMVQHRADDASVRVGVLVAGSTATNVAIDAEMSDTIIGGSVSITDSRDSISPRDRGPRPSLARRGTMVQWATEIGAPTWGGGDLAYMGDADRLGESDVQRMRYAELVLPADNTLAEGDEYMVTVDATRATVSAVCVWSHVDESDPAGLDPSDGYVPIDGDAGAYAVTPTARIYGGAGLVAGWRALADTLREVYSTRMRVLLSWARSSGYLTPASYGVVAGSVPAQTSGDRSGGIVMTVWGEDVDVRATVLDDTGSLVDTLTVTVTGSTAAASGTSTASLSSDTSYTITVDARDRGGSVAGTIYGILIHEEDA